MNPSDSKTSMPAKQGEQGDDLTVRPKTDNDSTDINDQDDEDVQTKGGGEDKSLRELEPRSIEKQFGDSPDINPTPDQERGTKEWYEHSDGMKKSFPDDGQPSDSPQR